MGHIRKGILGGFSGKVGTVVGASWKRTMYMRSLPKNINNPQTLGQRTQRAKFALVINLLRPLTAVLRVGWKRYATHQSAFNAATAHTLANAIVGTFPNLQIDYAKVMISKGSLTALETPAISSSGGNLTVSWDNNSGIGNAQATDKLLLAFINPAKNETIVRFNETERSEESFDLNLSRWVGDRIHVYIGFASEDGKEVSDSICFANIHVV